MRNLSYLCLLYILIVSLPIGASERSAEKYFDSVKQDPVLLRQFLYPFPKGGDLHNHIDGAIYAENMIKWAAQDGRCVDLKTMALSFAPCDSESGRPKVAAIKDKGEIVSKIIDAFSVRNFERREKSGSDQFFSTFSKFFIATLGREGEMLSEVTERAAKQNIGYLELMQSWSMGDARATVGKPDQQHSLINEIAIQAVKQIDLIEAKRRELQRCDYQDASLGCAVEVRYLAQVLRSFPRDQVRAQTKLAVRMIATDPRVVGINFVQPEHDPISLRDYSWQMRMIAEEFSQLPQGKRNISLHAGELVLGMVPPEDLGFHVREAIEIAGAKRIGHGVDVIYDPKFKQLLTHMAENSIAVEINLTSNDVILGVQGDAHPFRLFQQYQVPLTLSTDDEGVSRIDLTHEYQRAVQTYNLSYADIKNLARNAIEYSFLEGQSLFTNHGYQNLQHCRVDLRDGMVSNTDCAEFLNSNPKARAQADLELRIKQFESQY